MSKDYYETRIVNYKGGINRIPKNTERPVWPRKPNYGRKAPDADQSDSKLKSFESSEHHANS